MLLCSRKAVLTLDDKEMLKECCLDSGRQRTKEVPQQARTTQGQHDGRPGAIPSSWLSPVSPKL